MSDAPVPAEALDAYRQAHALLSLRAADSQQLAAEYAHVLALDASIRGTVAAALGAEAAARNRYTNVLPFDHNRVRLAPPAGGGGGDGGGGSDYINASAVVVEEEGGGARGGRCAYIATQGPLPSTAEHFWACVAGERAPAVVMLGNCVERGTVKCAPYFPAAAGGALRVGAAVVTPSAQLELPGGECTVRELEVAFDGGRPAPVAVHHLHHHAWPDHGRPQTTHGLRRMCRHLAALRARSPAGPAAAAPVVVHCSAGIGRSGTFIAVDVLLRRFRSWAEGAPPADAEQLHAALDVPALVHALRRQRAGMVQTAEQYACVYRSALDELAELLGEAG